GRPPPAAPGHAARVTLVLPAPPATMSTGRTAPPSPEVPGITGRTLRHHGPYGAAVTGVTAPGCLPGGPFPGLDQAEPAGPERDHRPMAPGRRRWRGSRAIARQVTAGRACGRARPWPSAWSPGRR